MGGAMVVCLLAVQPAIAELQNVEVGGEIKIRGRYFNNVQVRPGVLPFFPFAIRASHLNGRPIGQPGGNIFWGPSWDNDSNSVEFMEQRVRLNVSADFTDEVSAFIELDDYYVWGTNFRSNYITGADGPGRSINGVQVYQAYIEADDMFGQPLRARIGRQEINLGNQWLVGGADPWEIGLSFDAVRFTYTQDPFTIDAWGGKLTETSGALEEDGDVDFYGVYGTFAGMENVKLDAYWLWVRDARSRNDTNFIAPLEWAEDVLGLDDYDPSGLHTVGMRAYGGFGNFDFDAQAAYQFGEADQVGSRFMAAVTGLYGDDDADFDNWGMDAELGYSFDVNWQPRVFIGGAWFEGEDNRDISFLEWISPFDRPEASVSFNRLFSTWPYLEWYSNRTLSNIIMARAGVDLHPTEKIDVHFKAVYAVADEPFERPVVPLLSFWTKETDDYLGTETQIHVTYHYSKDLAFQVRWAHLFTGDGLTDGNFVANNGLGFSGGTDDKDADYFEFSTKLSF
jgi:hypothetical protein